MLENPSFEEGHTDLSGTIQEPTGWSFEYWELEMAGGMSAMPEATVMCKDRLPSDEWDDYIKSGNCCYKIFVSGKPMNAALSQFVEGLKVGTTYKLTVPVFVDTFAWDTISKSKVPPNSNDEESTRAARICLFAEPPSAFKSGAKSKWFDEQNFPGCTGYNPGSFYITNHELTMEFEAAYESMFVGIELWHPWKLANNGWFIDSISLVKVGDEAPTPNPPIGSGYKYPVIEKGSKVGIHTIQSNNVVNYVQQAAKAGSPFPIIKLVDNFSIAIELKEASPNTILVGRRTWPEGEGCGGIEFGSFDIHEHACAGIDRILDVIADNPKLEDTIDYWETGVNEADPPTIYGYRKLAELMIEYMDIAEQHNLKLALFSFNAGTPEWNEMIHIVDTGVFERATQGGHILTLHEGTFETHNVFECFDEPIPGSPYVKDAGCLNFRYRFLYHLLTQRDEVVPLVIGEWYCGDEQSANVETLVEAAVDYDVELIDDYYVLGFCPFTLGPSHGWSHTDWETAYPNLLKHLESCKDCPNALPPNGGDNDMDYDRHYVLMPPIEDDLKRLIWRSCIATATSYEWRTIGHSPQDAAYPGAKSVRITAINPDEWPSNLEEWLDDNFPPIDMYKEICAETPYEAAIKLQGKLDGNINLSQQDPRYANWDYGEATGLTIKQAGCYLTSLAMLFRDLLGLDILPTVLDLLLRLSQATYVEHNLVNIDALVDMFPSWFDRSSKVAHRMTVQELKNMLDDGWKIILPRSDGKHFVYLLDANQKSNTLTIIDSLDGKAKQVSPYWAFGARALHIRNNNTPPQPPTPTTNVLYGLHDWNGGLRMKFEECGGICLVHEIVKTEPMDIDLTYLADNGIKPILRLNWGYAHADGTLPPPGDQANAFARAVCTTINNSKGVYATHIGNEPNNRSEHPHGHKLTPQYVAALYNTIATTTREDILLGPPPVDPYYGPGDDNSIWWKTFLNRAERVDVLFLHTLKTQTNDPESIWSDEMFQDPPLTWQFLNAKSTITYLNMIPEKWRGVPVYITEANPQRKDSGSLGWTPDNDDWVLEAASFVNDINSWAPQPISGVIFYRYDLAGGGQEGFSLIDKPTILQAILKLCKSNT